MQRVFPRSPISTLTLTVSDVVKVFERVKERKSPIPGDESKCIIWNGTEKIWVSCEGHVRCRITRLIFEYCRGPLGENEAVFQKCKAKGSKDICIQPMHLFKKILSMKRTTPCTTSAPPTPNITDILPEIPTPIRTSDELSISEQDDSETDTASVLCSPIDTTYSDVSDIEGSSCEDSVTKSDTEVFVTPHKRRKLVQQTGYTENDERLVICGSDDEGESERFPGLICSTELDSDAADNYQMLSKDIPNIDEDVTRDCAQERECLISSNERNNSADVVSRKCPISKNITQDFFPVEEARTVTCNYNTYKFVT